MSPPLRGLLRGYHAITTLGALLETRSIADGPSAAELALEAEWRMALEPVLLALYLHPFRGGYTQLPSTRRSALKRWIAAQYTEHPESIVPLLLLLQRYGRRAANVGGQAALDLLAVPGVFVLTDAALLAALDLHAEALSTVDASRSLLDTTIDDLTNTLWPLIQNEAAPPVLQSAVEDYAPDRSAWRGALIAVSEESWAIATALLWTYRFNSVGTMRFTPREGACTICSPHAGETYPTNSVPLALAIPLHPGCRCVWLPDTNGWTAPDTIWTGGTLP